MNTFDNIQQTSKITSASWLEACVDLITDKGIYIWFRWQSLKQFDRLFFTKDNINEFFSRNIWTLVDWRINTSLKKIREKMGDVFIVWVDKESSIDSVFDEGSNIEYVYDITSWQKRKVLWIEIINGVKYINLSPMLGSKYASAEANIKLIYKFDDIKNEICTTARKRLTLDEIAESLYSVSNASFLNITDLPDVN